MEGGDGVVAIVRGLRDAGLAVTLIEGTTQYTLMPNAVSRQSEQKHVNTMYSHKSSQHCGSSEVCADAAMRCDSGAQATDGRYASIYKVEHCNITPTSPPVQLTEFPPQRAEICRGHGNFEVGGSGSGETYSPTRVSGSYRGGMSWPDRGSVCTPRPSHEPGAFANSLRKYPNISPERSAEIIERLINYTQGKNISKSKGYTSPIRNLESNPSSQTFDRNSSRNTMSRSAQRSYEPEVILRSRLRTEESPTRDGKPKRNSDCECCDRRPIFTRNYDVRCLREASRRVREDIRRMADSTNSVDMEIQAAVPIVSKEVTTLPKMEPSRRTVAVPLSPTSSNANRTQEGESKEPATLKETSPSFKYIQTTLRESIQTTSSSTKIPNIPHVNNYLLGNSRKSKSQEELRRNNDSVPGRMVRLLQDLCFYPDMKLHDCVVHPKEDLYYKGCKFDEKFKIKFGRCVTNISSLNPEETKCRKFSEHITNKCYTKIGGHNVIGNALFQAEKRPFKMINQKLEGVIEKWMNALPIKSYDFLGRKVDKTQVVNTVTNQLKSVFSTSKLDDEILLKKYIINIIQKVPVEGHGCCNKRNYLSKLADDLLKKIKNKIISSHFHNKPYIFKKYIQPTEDELKLFVKEELVEFFDKSRLKICSRRLEDIEMELTDLLIDSVEAVRVGNNEQVKEDVVTLLCGIGRLSEHRAIYFTNVVFEHLTEMLNAVDEQIKMPESPAFVVLQNTTHNILRQDQTTSNNLNETSDFSISGITEGDINANLDLYTSRLTEQISEWLTNILGPPADDKDFREVVVNDLAGDIVDRLKYLELSPSSRGTDVDELEHLKYQIFKWINKLVGDDNVATINHAAQLMLRIQSVPVPLLKIPQQGVNADLPPCCQIQTNLSPRGGSGSMPEAYQDSSSLYIKSNSPRGIASTLEKINFDSSHMPVFGSSGHGEMTVVRSDSKGTSDRRQSSPDGIPTMPNAGKISEKAKMSQMPMFGSSAPGKGMRESYRNAISKRRFNGPDANASKPIQSDNIGRMSINQMPMFELPGPGGSMTEAPNSATSNRRLSAPAGFSSKPIGRGNTNQTSSLRPKAPDDAIEASQLASPRRLDYAKIPCGNCLRSTDQSPTAMLSMKQLNEEYDEYVKDWVQRVPIATSSSDEEALTEKARLGMYNGIWKAITKLKLNPATFHNLFYYQDLLDDEIEELLNFLPQTPEMIKKKHLLKAQLIEKTTHTTEQIFTYAAPTSFRQQIVENVSNNLPRAAAVNIIEQAPPAELYEELQKLNLAEDFILYTSFKEDDKVKANVYRKKLLKKVEELVEAVKKFHGKDLKDVDAEIYIDDIMSALHKVPLPSEETIQEEADEILLCIEIDQWFTDLPFIPNDDYLEQLYRRRYRNVLAKKIHEMEKEKNFADSSSEKELKHEISRFLERVPLQVGQNVNKEFMVDELVNRLKNRPRDLTRATRRKSVAFEMPFDYEEFSQRMPLCSSYAELPSEQHSSYMIVGGTRVKDVPHYYQMKHPDTVDSDQKWLTLEDSLAPPSYHIRDYQPAGAQVVSERPPTSEVRAPMAMQVPQQDQQWFTIEDSGAPLCKVCSQGGSDQQTASGRPDNSPFQQFLHASLGHKSQMPYSKNNQTSVIQAAYPQKPMFQGSQATEQSQMPCSGYQVTSGIQISPQKHQTAQDIQRIRDSYQTLASRHMPGPYLQGTQETSGGGKSQLNDSFMEQRPYSLRRTNRVSTGRLRNQKPCSTNPIELDKSGNTVQAEQASEFHRSTNRENNQFTEQNSRSAHATGPGSISIYDQPPIGFSTPQQVIPQGTAPRPGRKQTRKTERAKRYTARRRLELEDLEEEDSAREEDEEHCRCMDQFMRCRNKRPMCYACNDFDMNFPPCLPIRFPCQYFY